MILPNIRPSFGRPETQVLIEQLARHTTRPADHWERRLGDEGLDALLDHPAALPSLMEGGGLSTVPASLVFYVLVRRALLDVGVTDSRIADYIASLLVEFGRRDRAFRIAQHDDEEYRYLLDMVGDIAEEPTTRRKFLLCAHLGNFSLWLAGIYPDYVVARVQRRGAPGLRYYEDLGAFGYRSAAETQLALALDLADIYHEAAELFPVLRRALNRLSDRYFFPVPPLPADRLLRQVADELGLN